MKAIYLIGFMGVGKTTIGKALGTKYSFPVYDTDQEIVKSEGMSINEIFELKGEEYFRELEMDILKKLPKNNCVITTGGGIILREENRRFMKESGTAVLLTSTIEEILKRIEQDDSRPLLKGDKAQKVFDLYEKRKSIYDLSANVKIDTTGKLVPDIIKEIEDCLKIRQPDIL